MRVIAVLLCTLKLHPDKNPKALNQHSKFVQLNEAYMVLVRPSSRSRYDLSLASKQNDKEYKYSNNTMNSTDFHRPFENDHTREHHAYSYYYQNYPKRKPVERINNVFIVIGCVLLILVGSVIHYATFRSGMTFSEKRLDEKDRRLQSIYSEVKLNAM